MRRLKAILIPLLALAAFAVVLVTLIGDHSSEYGEVAIPQGGSVELPEGTVKVFYEEPGRTVDDERIVAAPITFEVVPADTDQALAATSTSSGGDVERSEELGAFGSVAKIEVPEAGTYVVSGSSVRAVPGATLTFGTDPVNVLIDRWRLLAALLGAAILIWLIPTRRRPPEWDVAGTPSGWSSDPSTP